MIIRAAQLCLVSLVLSGCGGGGGGDAGAGAGGGGNTNNPIPPSAFVLTEANAVQAASHALAPLEQLFPAGAIALQGAAGLRTHGALHTVSCATTLPTTLTAAPALPVLVLLGHTDRDASGSVSVGDVVDFPVVDCNASRRKVTLTLTQLSETLDHIAGRVEVDTQTLAPPIRVVGSFDVSWTDSAAASESAWRITNATLTVSEAGATYTVRVASGQFTFTPMGYTFTITGGSVESDGLGGSFTFATQTPFVGSLRHLPTSGELALSTSAGSRARLNPPATPDSSEAAVEYAVAPSSSGAFAPFQQASWTSIIRGDLFAWRPNVTPSLTDVRIEPPNPSPGAALSVLYNAFDPDGDQLHETFEWRRNGTIVGNTRSLNIATARNDQISATVMVSDGHVTSTRTTTVTIGNQSPTLSLTLLPPQPDSSVDLVAEPNVFEPDGDPVTLTYEWTRNGTVVANRTTSMLPASETTRGDVISVRVAAKDDFFTVETTASVTVADSPPRLNVSSPPTTVAHGAPVTFTATVTDADGDPVDDFLLSYGPAGMTIDPNTGVVSWTASGPMFERTMTVAWAVTVDHPSALPATGALEVTDPSRGYALLRFGVRTPATPRAGLSIADFDNDGDVETLIMGDRWLFELEADGTGGYRQSWVYPYALNIDTGFEFRSTVATGDADGDGLHEIFAVVGRTITKLDGAERRAIATVQLGPRESCDDLHYTDLENDGAADLLCLARSSSSSDTARMLVFRVSDLSLRHEFPPAAYGRSLAIGNVDSDPARELVTANGYVFDGATFVNDWFYAPGFGAYANTGDLDADGIEEIVATNGATLRGYSATLRRPLWEETIGYFNLSSAVVADVTGDARPEILVGSLDGGTLSIYRYNSTASALDPVDQLYSEVSRTTAIGIGDVDDDGQREIVWSSGVGGRGVLNVLGFNPALTIEWANADPMQLDGPFKGGMLAGSALEPPAPLFFSVKTNGGYAGSRLVRMPSDGGALEISAEIDTNYANTGALDIVDYDDDGTDEAFVASHAHYDGVFRAYDFFSGTSEWSASASAALVDVTHADFTGDGKDELIGRMGAGVVVHDVYQRAVVWQSPTVYGRGRALVADLDGTADGQAEIVVVADSVVLAYRQVPPPTRFIQAGIYQANRPIVDADVGDTDGDGDAEVLLLLQAPGGAEHPSDVVKLDSSLQYAGAFTLPWSAHTLDIEPSSTPRKNLLIGRLAAREDGQIAVVDARAGNVVSESPPLVGLVQPGSVHYVTLPGETVPRISIGTSAGMYLTR